MLTSDSNLDLSSSGEEDASDVVRPVVNTVLAYINHGLNSGTASNVRKIVVESFSLKELLRSHDILYKIHKTSLNCPKPNRRVKDTCVSDILSWMQDLIKNDKVPYLVVDVSGIARLPRMHI